MGNNMAPYTSAIGEKYTYFITIQYNFFEKDRVEKGTLLNAKNESLGPFDYHLEICGAVF